MKTTEDFHKNIHRRLICIYTGLYNKIAMRMNEGRKDKQKCPWCRDTEQSIAEGEMVTSK